MECTNTCKANRARYEQLLAEHVTKWPDYCRCCDGWGQFTYSYDPSPKGVSLSSGWLEDAEPCPDCVEKGVCARCGKDGLGLESEGPCLYCNWDYDNGLPTEPECWCWAVADTERWATSECMEE